MLGGGERRQKGGRRGGGAAGETPGPPARPHSRRPHGAPCLGSPQVLGGFLKTQVLRSTGPSAPGALSPWRNPPHKSPAVPRSDLCSLFLLGSGDQT